MKYFWRLLILLCVAAGLMTAASRADAQTIFINATASTTNVVVSNSVAFTITVSNFTGLSLSDVIVTNSFSAPIPISTSAASFLITSNGIGIDLGPMTADEILQATFQATPTNTGTFTDTISAFSPGSAFSSAPTNITFQAVTSTNVPSQVNLAVSIAGPLQAVITNDLITYNVSVTNATGSSASGVFVTNVLPPGVIFKSVAPSNLKLTTVHSNQIFNLGTFPASGFTNIAVTIIPTNAGVLTLSAFVGSSGGLSSNAMNFATTNVTVMDPLPGAFTIVTNSPQLLNLQNGLTEQAVLVQNTSTTDAPAVRVVVDGLTKHLFNAVGTNNGNPFVYFSAPLPAGQSTNLLLQYSPRGNFAFTNTQLQAYAVPTPNWSPPPGIATLLASTNGSTVAISNQMATAGSILIEFPATLGRTYTIVYSSDITFSNAMIAPPSVVAPANQVQWIDYGPPTTISPPTSVPVRYYKVFLNP